MIRPARGISRGRVGWSLVIAVLVLLGRPAVARAHAYPVSQSPPPNAFLATPPSSVDLWFSERLEPSLSSIEVDDDQRRPIQASAGRVDPADPTHLTVALPPTLPNGTYTVVWRVVSADDGHATAGIYAFGIGVSPDETIVPRLAPSAAGDSEATVVGVLGRWLTYLGVVGLLGATIFGLILSGAADFGPTAPPTAGSDHSAYPLEAADLTARSVMIGALLVLPGGQVLRFAAESSLAGASANGPGPLHLLLTTRFARLWLVRSGLLAAALALVAPRRRPVLTRGFLIFGTFVGLALITDLAWSGHAAAGNLLAYLDLARWALGWIVEGETGLTVAGVLIRTARPAIVLIDWLHLLSVSTWRWRHWVGGDRLDSARDGRILAGPLGQDPALFPPSRGERGDRAADRPVQHLALPGRSPLVRA